jgi:hypothetical protein
LRRQGVTPVYSKAPWFTTSSGDNNNNKNNTSEPHVNKKRNRTTTTTKENTTEVKEEGGGSAQHPFPCSRTTAEKINNNKKRQGKTQNKIKELHAYVEWSRISKTQIKKERGAKRCNHHYHHHHHHHHHSSQGQTNQENKQEQRRIQLQKKNARSDTCFRKRIDTQKQINPYKRKVTDNSLRASPPLHQKKKVKQTNEKRGIDVLHLLPLCRSIRMRSLIHRGGQRTTSPSHCSAATTVVARPPRVARLPLSVLCGGLTAVSAASLTAASHSTRSRCRGRCSLPPSAQWVCSSCVGSCVHRDGFGSPHRNRRDRADGVAG